MYVEPVIPQPAALIFGAGHISKSLAQVAGLAGFRVTVVDDREQFANRERFPDAAEVLAGEYEAIFPELAIHEHSYLIIVTRGHRDDMRVLRQAVSTRARYIAMIGSKRKVIGVIRELEKEGVAREAFEHIHAPMGLDIGAITPEEIAGSSGGGDDRRAAAAGGGLEPAFALSLRHRFATRAAEVRIAGLILAAGASRRMGRPKALLPYQGETFLDRQIGLLGAVCADVVVVLGHQAESIRAGLARNAQARFVENPEPERGMLSSLQTGLAATEADAVLFTPLDYPAVRAETVAAIAARLGEGAELVVPRHDGRHGHPVGIAWRLAEEILALPLAAQARDVIHRHTASYLEVDDPGVLRDVDDPAEYARLVNDR